jgi:putative tricarboxylic transport membrane protein
MDLFFTSIIQGTKMCADPFLMGLVLVGVIWGVIAGALPGVGPSLAVGLALPFTFGLSATYAIAFLVAINVACSYGNSIPAILIGVPGTTSAVLTAIDGYALHKQGKSGLALGVQYYAAISGQFISNFFFLAMVVPLAQLTYVFLAPEMFALYFLGIVAVVSISSDNILKGLAAAAFGFALSMVGRDPVDAVYRYVFIDELGGGLEVMPVVLGMLAVSEIFRQMRQSFSWGELAIKFEAKFPPLKSLWQVTPPVIMGCVIGTIVGAIPGLGGTQAAFISYNQAKLWSKHPEVYGHGSVEGVAANEAAQNASQAGEMVPTFGLGIPGSSTMVFLFAAMLMNGFIPGPLLIQQAPQLLYAAWGPGLLAPTIMLAILGWPMCMVLLKVVTLNRTMILTSALILCMVGVFTLNRSGLDVFFMLFFGIIGYFMWRYGYPVACASLALVLGNGLEGHLRRGLVLLDGSWWAFVSRPWVALILAVSFALLIYGTWGTIKLMRQNAAYRRKLLAAHLASVSVSRTS